MWSNGCLSQDEVIQKNNMGSGSSRKPSDRPVIRVPKGKGTGTGGGQSGSSVADVCTPSFDVKIEYTGKAGVVALLNRASKNYQVIVDSKTVGELTDKLSVMVARCEALGVLYVGKVAYDKDKTPYARFNRPIA